MGHDGCAARPCHCSFVSFPFIRTAVTARHTVTLTGAGTGGRRSAVARPRPYVNIFTNAIFASIYQGPSCLRVRRTGVPGTSRACARTPVRRTPIGSPYTPVHRGGGGVRLVDDPTVAPRYYTSLLHESLSALTLIFIAFVRDDPP